MIADPDQAEEILASGKADMIAMARAFLDNPRWVWHAAERFGVKIDYPPQYARELRRIGFDFICVSSGATVPHAKIPVAPGFQVAFAERVRREADIKVRAVGMIASPEQAEDIVATGKADMVAMARAILDNPRWVWHAAEHFGVKIDYPPQYARSHPSLWPGAALARPAQAV